MKNYLKEKINNWYKNSEIDYGVTGKFIDCEAVGNNLIITFEEENEKLKTEVRNLKSDLEALKYTEKEVTNVDLIRSVSQLEKIILGDTNN